MMTDDETTDLIEQYLLGRLDADAHRAVEQRIRQDGPFRETVAFQQALIRQARQVGRNDLRNRLRVIATQQETPDADEGRVIPLPTRRTGQPLWGYTAIAASVAVLMLAGVWFWQTGRPINPTAQARFDGPGSQPVEQRIRIAGPVPRRVRVPLQTDGASAMGFAGTTDRTFAVVLIYAGRPVGTGLVRRYRFDDTLRLYGRFDPNRLSLRYDRSRDQYALRVDTATYQLRRYTTPQPLR